MKGAVKRKPAFSGPIAEPPSRAIIAFDSLPPDCSPCAFSPLVCSWFWRSSSSRSRRGPTRLPSPSIKPTRRWIGRGSRSMRWRSRSASRTRTNKYWRQLRERVAALPVDLQDVIDRLTPRLQAVDARLKELGTPSGDAKPAAPDAAGSLTPPAPAPAPAPIPASAPPKAAAPAAPAPAAKAPASPGTKAPPPAASPKAPGASSKSPEPDAVPEAKPKMPDTTPAASDSASLGVNAEWADQRKLMTTSTPR